MEAFKYSMVVSLQEVLDEIDFEEAYWSEDEDEDEVENEESDEDKMEREKLSDINSKEFAELRAALDAEFEVVLTKHLAKKEMKRQKDLAENKK